MTSSHRDSPRPRWVTSGILVLHAAGCIAVACATVVEEPAATSDTVQSAGLVTSTGGATSTENSATSLATSAGPATTNAVTTGAPETTSSVTSGEASTSASTSASITATTTASATVSSSVTANTATANTATSGTGTSNATAVTGSNNTTTGSFATTVTGGVGGASASATSTTNSTTGSTIVFCDAARTPSENVAAEGSTGSFATKDGVCYKVEFTPAAFAGWGCSNFEAGMGSTRTITVNGESVTCGELPLPEPVDGGYYFDFGPGTNVSAAMYWWNWQ